MCEWVNDGGLAFEDFTEPVPEGAEICWTCLGWGKISTIQMWAEVTVDCDDCDCNGYVMPGQSGKAIVPSGNFDGANVP